MDSFEKLIPLIFIVIWTIIAAASKKKQMQKPPDREKTEPRDTFFGKLQSSIDSFVSEMQQQNVEGFKEESKYTTASEEIDMEVTPEITMEPSKPVEREEKASRPYGATDKVSVQTDISKLRLREAVIWSEILGKPISIRD